MAEFYCRFSASGIGLIADIRIPALQPGSSHVNFIRDWHWDASRAFEITSPIQCHRALAMRNWGPVRHGCICAIYHRNTDVGLHRA